MNINKINLYTKNLIPFYVFFLLYSYAQAQNEVNTILTEANVEIPRISPIPMGVERVKNPVISLNGTW